MKNIFKLFMLMVLSFTMLYLVGCSSVGKGGNKSLLGTVKEIIVGDDYEAAGETLGNVSVTAYTILKGNPKYDKYTGKMEELWDALNKADSGVTAGNVNELALEVALVALTAKYGYAKASLITTGIRIGGAVADRIIAKHVDQVAAEQFLKGFKTGVDKALADIPDPIVVDEKNPKYITCQKGQTCEFKFTNRSVDVQLTIAKELRDFGFLDEKEKRKDEYSHTKKENVEALIERTEKLREVGIKKVNVWIAEVGINAEGKLEKIKFLYENFDGDILETDCVSCVTNIETAE